MPADFEPRTPGRDLHRFVVKSNGLELGKLGKSPPSGLSEVRTCRASASRKGAFYKSKYDMR